MNRKELLNQHKIKVLWSLKFSSIYLSALPTLAGLAHSLEFLLEALCGPAKFCGQIGTVRQTTQQVLVRNWCQPTKVARPRQQVHQGAPTNNKMTSTVANKENF